MQKISIPPRQKCPYPHDKNGAYNISINKSLNNTSASNDARDTQPKKKKSDNWQSNVRIG